MEPVQWLASFKVLHDQNRRGGLNPSEKKKYLQMRDELARSLMQSQNLTVPTNVAPRRALGVAQLFSIELQNVHRVMTRELSCTGYVALVPATFGVGLAPEPRLQGPLQGLGADDCHWFCLHF